MSATPLPVDQEDRDRARLHLHANAVVEAGAGTGKTTLLTDRLLFQLLAGDKAAAVTQLVALTFTEKAAAEIKVRLADKLSEVAAGKGESAERILAEVDARFGVDAETAAGLARRALEDLDKAQIGTIHSFAAHVLRLFPIEAGVDPSFKVDEGPLFDELFDAEWAAFLDEELGEKPPRGRQWLDVLRLCPLEDLRGLAVELCRERIDLDGVGRADPDAAARLEALAAELAAIPATQEPPHRSSKIAQAIEGLCERLGDLALTARMDAPELPDRMTVYKLPGSSWPKNWEPELAVVYERALMAAGKSSPEGEAVVRAACALVLPFARRFRRSFARRGLISFDGLLRRARDLVRDHPEAREELKRQYAALFIDEFQDTDPLQGEFLMLLAEAPGVCATGWENAALGPGRLFVVGDPKQSIYRFRGADIAAYERFTARILASGPLLPCDLTANFRSPAGLIGPVNAIFEELMLPVPGLQAPYKALSAGKNADPSPAVELVVARTDEGADEVRRLEASFIADWIARHCGEGKAWRFKDVAVLARTGKPFPELVDALRAAGVPYVIETKRGFYGSAEVLDLINLLRALDDPEDSVALAGLLRSPLCLLPDQELLELSQKGRLSYLRDTGKKSVDDLCAQLRRLRARVGRVPLGELVGCLLRETNLYELSARAYHGAQTVANLSKFARLAAQASDDRSLTLKEFVAELFAELDDPQEEGESPLADEHLEAVRLLTVHKSKGLEFPVVFFTNASSRPFAGRSAASCVDWGSGRTGLRLEKSGAASAAMAWLEPQEKEREAHEARRVLYVALTRAKQRLFIVGAETGEKAALTSLLAQARAWPPEAYEKDTLPVGAFLLPVHFVTGEPAEPAHAAARAAEREAPDVAVLAAAWKTREKNAAALSRSRWTTSPTDQLAEAPKSPFPSDEGESSSSANGALVGRLCHKVLEWTDFAAPPKKAALEAQVGKAAAALSRLSPGGDWPAAQAEALAVLDAFLRSDAAKALSVVEIVGREIPFCRAEDGVLMRGQLDLLYREKSGALVVADYKTEAVTLKQLEARRAKYEAQGEAYCKAVEGLAQGKPVSFKLIFLRAPR